MCWGDEGSKTDDVRYFVTVHVALSDHARPFF